MQRPPDPLRILLVDDDPDRRQHLVSALYAKAQDPIAVTTAGRPRAIIPSHRPSFDVALLALSPGTNPEAKAKELAAHLPGVPIVTVDGDPETADMQYLLSRGVQDHLPLQCTSCPGSPRLISALHWAVERRRLLDRLAAMQKRCEHQALHDALTGLPNRQLFRDRLRHVLAQAKRRGGLLAVLFVDLDRFKEVNDQLGHDIGDQLLVEVADRLSACVRASDTCARWGGDEFTVALDHVRLISDVAKIARKINIAIATPLRIGGQSLKPSASIGISLYPFDGRNEETLLHQADTAMYRAKSAGGNGYHFFRRATDGQDQSGPDPMASLSTRP